MALTPDDVRSRLEYRPETGDLIWKPRAVHSRTDRTWNTRYAGKVTGYRDYHGYLVVNICGRPHAAHRLAWAIEYGRWPAEFLDHINCDKTDNRLLNLREASPAENTMNKPVRKDSLSGLKGVQLHRETGRWRARIKVNGRSRSLGLYDTPLAASVAYEIAAKDTFGEFAYGGAS